MGVMILISQARGWDGAWPTTDVNLSIPYTSISVSLNIILTLMIVIRLVLHGRNIRAATGSTAGIGGLYKNVATMLIESSALYAVNSLLLIGLWAAGNAISNIFLPTLCEIQVCILLWLRSSGGQTKLTTDWTGHRPAAYHSTRRKQGSVDELRYHLRTNQLIQCQEPREADGRQRSTPRQRGTHAFGG